MKLLLHLLMVIVVQRRGVACLPAVAFSFTLSLSLSLAFPPFLTSFALSFAPTTRREHSFFVDAVSRGLHHLKLPSFDNLVRQRDTLTLQQRTPLAQDLLEHNNTRRVRHIPQVLRKREPDRVVRREMQVLAVVALLASLSLSLSFAAFALLALPFPPLDDVEALRRRDVDEPAVPDPLAHHAVHAVHLARRAGQRHNLLLLVVAPEHGLRRADEGRRAIAQLVHVDFARLEAAHGVFPCFVVVPLRLLRVRDVEGGVAVEAAAHPVQHVDVRCLVDARRTRLVETLQCLLRVRAQLADEVRTDHEAGAIVAVRAVHHDQRPRRLLQNFADVADKGGNVTHRRDSAVPGDARQLQVHCALLQNQIAVVVLVCIREVDNGRHRCALGVGNRLEQTRDVVAVFFAYGLNRAVVLAVQRHLGRHERRALHHAAALPEAIPPVGKPRHRVTGEGTTMKYRYCSF
eukprot:Rhum_TRINITY_DN27_c0_g2::Rhum_TRINITY_DN27_c0_g2_i1::g.83::m.83